VEGKEWNYHNHISYRCRERMRGREGEREEIVYEGGGERSGVEK
jgi:hypothetical protein